MSLPTILTPTTNMKYQVLRLNMHGNFSPLVFSTSGGMGASNTVAYNHLAFLLSHTEVETA